jgi:hypothetical protein
MAHKPQLQEQFSKAMPGSYQDIVKAVVTLLADGAADRYAQPDPEKIHVIDDGDYQGTQLFVIAANTYQPRRYWVVFVDYGSCSGCDSLQAIREDHTVRDEATYAELGATPDGVEQLMTMALHIVQEMKEIEA